MLLPKKCIAVAAALIVLANYAHISRITRQHIGIDL